MPKIDRVRWTSAFKRAFRKRVMGTPDENLFRSKLETFTVDPFDPGIRTHKRSGRLEGLWAFSVNYDCRVVVRFLSDEEVLLVDIGSHDEVY